MNDYAENVSEAKKELWFKLETIELTAMTPDVAREDVLIALVQFIERKSKTTEFEDLVRKVCKL